MKSHCRQPRETLQHLHSDIRRLTALAFPKMENPVREVITCDYFIDMLNDPALELALRERLVRHPDVALSEALHLQLWQK